MSERIKCPVCSVGLILPESALRSSMTCPRCLAEVTALEARREAGAIQTERPERREGALSCPHCGRTVEAIWITCPWCEEPLRGRERGRNGAADLDVRRDAKRTSCLVIVLAVIGGLSFSYSGGKLLFYLGGALSDPAEFDPYTVLLLCAFCFLLPLLFLAGLSTLIVFVRSRGNPGAISFRRVAVGTLAIAGGLVTLGGLTVLAIFILLLLTCAKNGGRLDL
jgi:hypothetical protein